MLTDFIIRASYPNYYMVNKYAEMGRDIFNRNIEDKDNVLKGNKPGTVIYSLTGDDTRHEFPPRWYDMYYLMRARGEEQRRFLEMLLRERFGEALCDRECRNTKSPETESHRIIPELEETRNRFRQKCIDYVAANPLHNSDELITTLVDGDFTDEQISYKGRMLLDLTRNCYPVPDFCILTTAAFQQPERLEELLEAAIHNLEVMTSYQLGSDENPLVFAIRCAMPQYIPGLMPTLLNIGVTRRAYQGLCRRRIGIANRVYLSTLHTICEMLRIEKKYDRNDIELTPEEQTARIAAMEQAITAARDDGERLLTDAHYQSLRLMEYVRNFYIDNQDLILTFMQGKQAYPSFILQRMVWTIGNEQSYPGVLYSHHSRTGSGRQIESYRNIFGEEIMTGDVTSTDVSYHDRAEIKHDYPAVFHFDPLLDSLEERHKSPVTIEFAVETRPRKISLFAVLQLNMSEMTGRAALVSSIDLLNRGMIEEHDVTTLIKPYHLRQIVSNSIDDRSLADLQLFGRGISVLPRTAITATLCFTPSRAQELKKEGNAVCLCQERFVPEDTITLGELDAILSLSPAAIHVVTACRGYGIPALMDLQNYGIRQQGKSLVNGEGLVINEGDKITISSKRQTIYKGVADYKPARFTKYLEGQSVRFEEGEELIFRQMKEAYERYQQIVTSDKASFITDVNKLARLIRCDLQDKPSVARGIVNNWYSDNAELYVGQVLQSKMGDHLDQSRVFNLLSRDRKVDFFHRATDICIERHLGGLRAGSFMLGRFVAKPLPTTLWNKLSDLTVAFLLNEYVMYEKYLQVLEEVGEIKLARAHSKIQTEGIDNMTIRNFDLYNFVPLLYSAHDWSSIAQSLEQIEHQDNTHLLVEKLSQPVEQLFDFTKPWVVAEVEAKRKVDE
ncbi:MAG: hypothetical protein IJP80_02615 [Bacteroidales bacterium]|nr:hypothetical protein [Bacteroidales bacterium]